jgi:hypothetical protein
MSNFQNQARRDLNNNINQDKEAKKSKKQPSLVLTINFKKGHFINGLLIIY